MCAWTRVPWHQAVCARRQGGYGPNGVCAPRCACFAIGFTYENVSVIFFFNVLFDCFMYRDLYMDTCGMTTVVTGALLSRRRVSH